jgi:predicted PurR-regulated permease PerM
MLERIGATAFERTPTADPELIRPNKAIDRELAALNFVAPRIFAVGTLRRSDVMDFIRASRERRYALDINDPQPVARAQDIWQSAGRAAIIGIFLLLVGGFLYVGRSILLPIFAAAVVAMTLAPLVRLAKRQGVSPWITALVIVALALGALGIAVTAIAAPVSEWMARAPEIGSTIRERLSVLEAPLAALRELEGTLFGANNAASSPPNIVLPAVAFLTPAAGELLLFFGALIFFLVGQSSLRSNLVAMFSNRDAKLRFLKILNDIEHNLTGYLAVVTVINAAVGTIVAAGAWLLGLPSPVIFGVLAAVLNYVPYVGPAVMVVALFGVGLVTFPSLGHALVAPLAFIVLTTAEGHFVTPTIVGRRLTLNPLLVFLALAFWTWMWGPIGAFLAVPLSIIGLVVINHLFPADDSRLPD